MRSFNQRAAHKPCRIDLIARLLATLMSYTFVQGKENKTNCLTRKDGFHPGPRLSTPPIRGIGIVIRQFQSKSLKREPGPKSAEPPRCTPEVRITDAVVDHYWTLGRRSGNRVAMVARITGPPDPTLADRLGELKLPVLIQWGELDRRIPLSNAHGFQRGIAGAELRIYLGPATSRWKSSPRRRPATPTPFSDRPYRERGRSEACRSEPRDTGDAMAIQLNREVAVITAADGMIQRKF